MTQARDDFGATQRAAWDSVADGWREWWPVFEEAWGETSRRLVEAAEVAPGARVLDVATGLGEPAITAARRVGPSGFVLGTDLSPEMLEHARERVREAGLRNLEFTQCDAEELDFEGDAFDAALSRFGLMLLQNPERALAAIHHSLGPNARFAASVWGTSEEVPFLSLPGRVARSLFGLSDPDPELPGPFRLGREGELARLFASTGFTDVRCERVAMQVEFESPAMYVSAMGDLSNSLRQILEERTEGEREDFQSSLTREVEGLRGADGRVVFENAAWIVSGAKPG